jgi:hypothetical protein
MDMCLRHRTGGTDGIVALGTTDIDDGTIRLGEGGPEMGPQLLLITAQDPDADIAIAPGDLIREFHPTERPRLDRAPAGLPEMFDQLCAARADGQTHDVMKLRRAQRVQIACHDPSPWRRPLNC